MISGIDISKLGYAELKRLMEDAEREVENRKSQFISDLRGEIDQKLFDAGLSIYDLYPELSKNRVAKVAEREAVEKQQVVPKYRNPDNAEETWTGRGRVIHWVLRIAEDRNISVDDIKNDVAFLNPDHPKYETHKQELSK